MRIVLEESTQTLYISMPAQSSMTYTLSSLLDDCAESPKHSKANGDTFKMVWGGLMAWMSSNWMTGKGDTRQNQEP